MFGLVVAFLALASATGASAQSALPPPEGEVLLRVSGRISRTNAEDEAHFDRAMIEALPRHALHTTTSVTDGVRSFEGFLMRDLLELVGANGTTITATALNDYVIDIPISDFTKFDVLAAYRMDDQALTTQDKGPLWIVYPRDEHRELQDIRYDYRWVWQLIHIEVR
ncbi:MAG: molybdopterin-dependent oxidoreductase [Rhizobiaceae bacterium]|nr:molybdopterin-dependent oxidoreductase [Rhizobiaceae bacterium]MCV0405353.1 molybdopterin-dependent oxidoreductase [Rhizobiaceae bacterium]